MLNLRKKIEQDKEKKEPQRRLSLRTQLLAKGRMIYHPFVDIAKCLDTDRAYCLLSQKFPILERTHPVSGSLTIH